MKELINKLNSMLNNNPTRYIKTEADLIEFINQPCTKEDLTCFLNKLLKFEEYEYACIVRDKLKEKVGEDLEDFFNNDLELIKM